MKNKTDRKKNNRRYDTVLCTRVADSTLALFKEILKSKHSGMSAAELVREYIIAGLARDRVEHVKQ